MSPKQPPKESAKEPTGGIVWFDEPPPPRATAQLSRDRIVAAAIALADADPRGEVTMRAVAQRVGARTPMSLYRYVGSKDGLVDLMVDAAYGEITVPATGDWRTVLRAVGLSAWDVVGAHPWFARLSFTRPPLGPNALRLFDTVLSTLESLELDAATRMRFVQTVLGHVFGSGLALLEERAMRHRVGLRTEEELAEAARGYHERIAATGDYPHYVRWVTDPARLHGEPEPFEQILDWLLDGLGTLVH